MQEDLLVMGEDFSLLIQHSHTHNQMCIYKNLGDMGSVVGGPCIIGRGVRIIFDPFALISGGDTYLFQ